MYWSSNFYEPFGKIRTIAAACCSTPIMVLQQRWTSIVCQHWLSHSVHSLHLHSPIIRNILTPEVTSARTMDLLSPGSQTPPSQSRTCDWTKGNFNHPGQQLWVLLSLRCWQNILETHRKPFSLASPKSSLTLVLASETGLFHQLVPISCSRRLLIFLQFVWSKIFFSFFNCLHQLPDHRS